MHFIKCKQGYLSISMTASGEVSELAMRYPLMDFYSLSNLTLSEGGASGITTCSKKLPVKN